MSTTVSAKISLSFPAFDVSDAGKTKLAVALRDMLKKQAKDGVQVTGEGRFPPMPRGKRDGKRLDLDETGAMWGEVIFSPLKLTFTVPYAGFVIPKYAAGLSPRYQELYEAKALPVVSKNLIVKKDK